MSFFKLVILIFLGYYLFRDFDIAIIAEHFKSYSISLIIMAMLSVILSDFLLSLRWRYISNKTCDLKSSFEVIVLSGLINFILPAKLGELSKAFYLNKLYKIELPFGFNLIIYERILDIFLLALLAIFAIMEIFNDVHLIFYLVIFFFSFWIFLLLIKSNYLNFLLERLLGSKFSNSLISTKELLAKNFTLKKFTLSIIFTTFVWLSFMLTTFLVIESSNISNLSLADIILVFIVSAISMSISLTPGGVGFFQAGIIFALGLFNVSHNEALSLGIILHIVLLLPSMFVAIIVFLKKEIAISSLVKK